MKHPVYTFVILLSCVYLLAANLRGWNFFQSNANRSALSSTSYRYRPATGSGGWFSGSGFHK